MAKRPGRAEGADLDQLHTEQYWRSTQEALTRYLSRRGRGYRRRAMFRRARDFLTRNSGHAWITFRRVALASLALLLTVAVDGVLGSLGWDETLRRQVTRLYDGAGLAALPNPFGDTGALGAAAVQIAGVSLPLFYTVLSASLIRGYQNAPESVRAYALKRSFIRFFEVPAWTLGVWGVALVATAEAGFQLGPVAIFVVTSLGVFVIAAIPLAFWRVVSSASPRALVGDMVSDLTTRVDDAKSEIQGKADPEVLQMLRRLASQDLQVFVEVSSFVDSGATRSQSAANAMTRGALVCVLHYAKMQGRVPQGSDWHEGRGNYASPFRMGGTPGPEAQARLVPRPVISKDEAWFERGLAKVMANGLRAALRDAAGDSIRAQMEMCALAARASAASWQVEGALAIARDVEATMEAAGSVSPEILALTEDGMGAMFHSIIDGLAEAPQDVRKVAEALHDLTSPLAILPSPAGPEIRRLAPEIRLELESESRIEGEVRTPVEATTERLLNALHEDLSAAVEHIVALMVERAMLRASGRQKGAPAAGIPGLLHLYHTLARIERKIGELEPPLHTLDAPTYVLRDQRMREAVVHARRRAIEAALPILPQAPHLRHSSEDPDWVGNLYYFTALECVTAFSDGPWPAGPKCVGEFLQLSLRFSAILLAELPGGPMAGRVDAALSPLREGLRVSGYGLLWSAVSSGAQEVATRGAIKEAIVRAATGQARSDKDILIAWARMMEGWSNFPYQDTRFHQDNDMWDLLVRSGLAQPMTRTGYGPTESAARRKHALISAVSREPDEVLHDMDAVALAVMSEEVGVSLNALPRRVAEMRRLLSRTSGKYGPFAEDLARVRDQGGQAAEEE